MYVCLCKLVSDRTIKEKNLKTLDEVKKKTGACTDCALCTPSIKKILKTLDFSP